MINRIIIVFKEIKKVTDLWQKRDEKFGKLYDFLFLFAFFAVAGAVIFVSSITNSKISDIERGLFVYLAIFFWAGALFWPSFWIYINNGFWKSIKYVFWLFFGVIFLAVSPIILLYLLFIGITQETVKTFKAFKIASILLIVDISAVIIFVRCFIAIIADHIEPFISFIIGENSPLDFDSIILFSILFIIFILLSVINFVVVYFPDYFKLFCFSLRNINRIFKKGNKIKIIYRLGFLEQKIAYRSEDLKEKKLIISFERFIMIISLVIIFSLFTFRKVILGVNMCDYRSQILNVITVFTLIILIIDQRKSLFEIKNDSSKEQENVEKDNAELKIEMKQELNNNANYQTNYSSNIVERIKIKSKSKYKLKRGIIFKEAKKEIIKEIKNDNYENKED